MLRKGIYAGAFDILTNGHWWMIKQGVLLFDHLHVAIGVNPAKKTSYFTVEEREQSLKDTLRSF
jgi:pantetheine-phosphate adenylyltransferase